MSESTSLRRAGRIAGVSLLTLGWIGIGLGVGWAVGFLVDQLVLPEHHALVFATLALCALVLGGWLYGSYLVLVEVLAGVEEATSDTPTRSRTGYRYVAIAAAPIIGILIGLSSAHLSSHGGGGNARPAVTTIAPADVIARSNEVAGHTPRRVAATSYVVRPGDRLTDIAEHFYGTASDWPLLASANAGRLDEKTGTRLVDPSMLPVGIRLVVPAEHLVATTPPEVTKSSPSPSPSPARDDTLYAALASFGLLGAALFARRQRGRRAYQQMRSPAGAVPAPPEEADAEVEAELRPLVDAELPEWIDAANRRLLAGLDADRSLSPPKVSVVRAGPMGLELLLDEACDRAPLGFIVLDGGRSWRLDPAFELDELRDPCGKGCYPYLPALFPIGEDATGSYLVACGAGETLSIRGSSDEIARALGAVVSHLSSATWGEVELYRVGEASFVGAGHALSLELGAIGRLDEGPGCDPLWRIGLPESQPVILVQNPEIADKASILRSGVVSLIGPCAEADRYVYLEDGMVTIEPLGLCVPALLPSLGELETAERLRAVASATPEQSGEEDLAEVPAAELELPAAGAVEVRILRALPDLVGDVDPGKVSPVAVQVAAYLVLHGRKTVASKLQDALAVYRPGDSRRLQTIWNQIALARAGIGQKYFPTATNRPYILSAEVSCDWLRFKETVSIARSLERSGQPLQAIEALRVALELLGEGAPCSSQSILGRYRWLDAEQFHVEIEATIVRAAHMMAMLSIVHHPYQTSLDDAAWAIGRARVVCPDARGIREAAIYLADARDDDKAIDDEFLAAVDAAYALWLGDDVDPALEALYGVMKRIRQSAAPADANLA